MRCDSQPEQVPASWRDRLLTYWIVLLFALIMGLSLFGALLLQNILE